MTVCSAIKALNENRGVNPVTKAIAAGDWPELEREIFAAFPNYQSLDFYRLYVAPGTEGFTAWQAAVKASKPRVRKPSSKSSKKAAGVQVSPAGQGSAEGPSPEPVATPLPAKSVLIPIKSSVSSFSKPQSI